MSFFQALQSTDGAIRHPRAKLSASLQDSHVYICHRKVLTLLEQKPHFESFREDFIPWVCKIQYQRRKRRKYSAGAHFPPSDSFSLITSCQVLSSTQSNHISQNLALKHSNLNNDSDKLTEDDDAPNLSFKVTITIHQPNSGLALRINNVYSFLEINRSVRQGRFEFSIIPPLTIHLLNSTSSCRPLPTVFPPIPRTDP